MILSKNKQCPPGNMRGLCVEVTAPKTFNTPFGKKKMFSFCYEVEKLRDDGMRYRVYSRPFTASLSETSNLSQYLCEWFGRDMNAQELDCFDTNLLIGRPAFLRVSHVLGKNGCTYANITEISQHLSSHGQPLALSNQSGHGRACELSADNEQSRGRDWLSTCVHVGKNAGTQLGDIYPSDVSNLCDHWLPLFERMEAPSASDTQLATALRAARITLMEIEAEKRD